MSLRACAEEAATRAQLFTHSPAYRTLSGRLKVTSIIVGTSEPKHPCPCGLQVELFSDCVSSNVKHTDELCFTRNFYLQDCCHGMCLKSKTLTHLTVLIHLKS